jgi:hypothetical protein
MRQRPTGISADLFQVLRECQTLLSELANASYSGGIQKMLTGWIEHCCNAPVNWDDGGRNTLEQRFGNLPSALSMQLPA